MSAKLKANTHSELTKLKLLWRDSLAEDARHYWLSLFISPEQSQAQIRAQLHQKLKVHLRHDSQLTKFRDWVTRQELRDREAERQADDETQIAEQFPAWTADQLRAEVLRRSYARSLADGDFESGRATMKQDLAERTAVFNAEAEQRKLTQKDAELKLKTEALAQAERKLKILEEERAEERDRVQKAREEITSALNDGLTPEALARCERALNIL